MIEKFYIVDRESRLGKDYIEYSAFVEKISDVFDKFSKENQIEAKSFCPDAKRLFFEPSKNDIERFQKDFLRNQIGMFKFNSKMNKEWVAFCKANGIDKNIHKPFVPFYFKGAFGNCRTRLFDIKETIYCSLESETDFTSEDGITEIKASQFYSAIENANETQKK